MRARKRLPLAEYIEKKTRLKRRTRAKSTSKSQNADLRAKLLAARTAAGLKQFEAGEALGRDQTFIAKIESGARAVSFVEVEQLARIYGKQLTDFSTMSQMAPVRRIFSHD
jgi:ribosome-binding protein aMBF1 (putative translation factor)